MINSKYTYYEFNYADITLDGYGKDTRDSSQLLKAIISKLNEPSYPISKKTIDRFENRSGTEQRLLVHISAPFEKGGKRVFGRIALIKKKDIFLVNLSEAELIEVIEKPGNKEFVEITHYSITFEPKPIIMVEFNSSGPRLSDIEYYFRQIGREEKIAKAIKSKLHLSIDYSQLSSKIGNIFKIDVKVAASQLFKNGSENWLQGMKQLKDDTGYRDVRLEFSYPRIKPQGSDKYQKNIKGLTFARNILDWLKKDSGNINNLDDLKMAYTIDGSDEIIDLDFIKDKTTSIVSVTNNVTNRKVEFNTEVGQEFNLYLSTGKVTTESKQ